MFKTIVAGALGALLLCGVSFAQTCPAYTYTLANGTTADANQVMANFNTIATCANSSLAPLASAHFTGNVGVGTAAGGWSGNGRLSGQGDVSNPWGVSGYSPGLSSNGGAFIARVDNASTYFMAFYYGGPTFVGSITSSGSAVSYNTTSDYRLKTNVAPITDGLARLMQLQPKTFNWKAQPKEPRADGFLAHEVQAVLPYAVVGEKDAVNRDGSIKPQQVDYSKLVPLLVAAVKEEQAEIEGLKAQVAALKSAH